MLVNPAVVFEALSQTTESGERGWKSAAYRQVESLREYVLVSQSEPRIEVFRRASGGKWVLSEFTGMMPFASLKVSEWTFRWPWSTMTSSSNLKPLDPSVRAGRVLIRKGLTVRRALWYRKN